MTYYQLLKIAKKIKSIRLKVVGIGLLYAIRKPYLHIFLDPLIACNLRCKMCYFSKPSESGIQLQPAFSETQILQIADNFFPSALRLQIGCGAEPSLYKGSAALVRLAKRKGVAQVSYTTNGNLLRRKELNDLLEAGLDEMILSMHGVSEKTYEELMPGANFKVFHEVLLLLEELRVSFPKFQLRINYTINPDNLEELSNFFEIMSPYTINILQLRPIRCLGTTEYNNFDLFTKKERYEEIVKKLIRICHDKGVVCLANPDLCSKEKNSDSLLSDYSYCYISPGKIAHPAYQIEKESWTHFQRRRHFFWKCLSILFKTLHINKKQAEAHSNYEVTT